MRNTDAEFTPVVFEQCWISPKTQESFFFNGYFNLRLF